MQYALYFEVSEVGFHHFARSLLIVSESMQWLEEILENLHSTPQSKNVKIVGFLAPYQHFFIFQAPILNNKLLGPFYYYIDEVLSSGLQSKVKTCSVVTRPLSKLHSLKYSIVYYSIYKTSSIISCIYLTMSYIHLYLHTLVFSAFLHFMYDGSSFNAYYYFELFILSKKRGKNL